MTKKKKKKISKFYNASDNLGDKFLTIIFLPLKVFLYYFGIQFILRLVFKFKHRVKFSKGGHKIPKAPFLLLGNHVTNWDGIYHNAYLKRFIYFIMHDELFKYKASKVIAYNLLGQIKRGNSKSDIGSLRKLVDIRDAGKCIGIFPEGDISYVGKSLEIDKSIAKLAKILNMPIVLTRIDGASFQKPRWSFKSRKCPVKVTVTDVINQDESKAATNDELFERIQKGITYDDNAYQLKAKNIIKSKKPAENLEFALFLCPDCGSNGEMESKGDRFYCKKCGYEIRYKQDAQFELIRGSAKINNISEWSEFQNKKVIDVINDSIKDKCELIELKEVFCNKINDGDYFYKHQDIGTLSLNYKRLKFVSNSGHESIFPIKEISELCIQFKGTVEILVGKHRFRFTSSIKQHYGYRFECFIDAIMQNKVELEKESDVKEIEYA